MTAQIIPTTLGRDEIVQYIKSKLEDGGYFKLGEGGFVLSGLTIEVIDAGAVGGNSEYNYVVSGGEFDIIGVSIAADTFTIDDDYVSYFPIGTKIVVDGSSGNDGTYTVKSRGVIAGDTVIEVEEDVTNATADGVLYVDHLPIARSLATPGGDDSYHWQLVVVEYTPLFGIIGVDTVSETFTISGDHQSTFPAGTEFRAQGSTGNDGLYTVKSVSLSAGDTVIEVNEDITDITVDGGLKAVVQKLKDTTGVGNLTQTVPGGGTGTGTVNYKTGGIHAEFENDVAAGNEVATEFKYHDIAKAPVAAKTMLEADDPSIDISGIDFFSFQKEFDGSDASTKIVFQGAGTGKLKCYVYMHEYEGIDDGYGTSYGGTPFYFEGGLFDGDGDLLMYFTFEKERKTGATTISHVIDIYM